MITHNQQPLGRLWLLRILVVVILAVLSVRLYRVQIGEGSTYRLLADRNRLRRVEMPAPRGVIYDQRGTLLVRNDPSFTVEIVPADLPKNAQNEPDVKRQKELLDRLMALLPPPLEKDKEDARGEGGQHLPDVMKRAEIERLVEEGQWGGAYRPVTIAKYIDEATAFQVAEMTPRLPGVNVVAVPVRNYLEGSEVSHILGYMGPISPDVVEEYEGKGYVANESIGQSGLEATYESEMHGVRGRQTIEVDVNGHKVRTIGQPADPEPGHNLTLTIDLELQKVATKYLQEAISQTTGFSKATQGIVVAMDPRNGAIRAMVSLPSYDNNLFAQGISQADWDKLIQDPNHPLLNLAVSGEYPPGSTFKLVPAAAGLQEGVITPDTRLGDGFDGANDGIIYIANRFYPNDMKLAQPFYCWIHTYGRGHGKISLRDAIAQSCDTFFYQLGGGYPNLTQGVGLTAIGKYARRFGFGFPTGIELIGEAAGQVPDDKYKRLGFAEPWTIGDTYNMSIGQGFMLSTPLQLANMTAAVANRGKLYRPQLVERITDDEGKTVREFAPILNNEVEVDKKNLDVIREGMFGAINWPQGTAPIVKLPDIAVAGKTGTAEFFRDEDKDGKEDRNDKDRLPTHAWFTAFAPYNDPEMVVTVLVPNGGEGSAVAAPVAARILRWYFKVPDLPPTPTPAAR